MCWQLLVGLLHTGQTMLPKPHVAIASAQEAALLLSDTCRLNHLLQMQPTIRTSRQAAAAAYDAATAAPACDAPAAAGFLALGWCCFVPAYMLSICNQTSHTTRHRQSHEE
jgi:hypothetical protein